MYNWTYGLNDQRGHEIEDAFKHFQSLGKPLGFIDQETFPQPKLHAALRVITDELHNRRGFKVLRGLLVAKHSTEDNVIIYAGVSAYVALVRGRQDR